MNAIELKQKYCMDVGFKVSGNEKGTKRIAMEKVFKDLSLPRAWKKVKKGDSIIIRSDIDGKEVDVARIEYLNPNAVQITARGGSANMVDLKNVSVMVPKIAGEGFRSYKDSVEENDVAGACAVNTGYSSRSNVEKRLAVTRRGRAMTLPQYGTPIKVTIKRVGNSFVVYGVSGNKISKSFATMAEAEKFIQGNGRFLLVKDSIDMADANEFCVDIEEIKLKYAVDENQSRRKMVALHKFRKDVVEDLFRTFEMTFPMDKQDSVRKKVAEVIETLKKKFGNDSTPLVNEIQGKYIKWRSKLAEVK